MTPVGGILRNMHFALEHREQTVGLVADGEQQLILHTADMSGRARKLRDAEVKRSSGARLREVQSGPQGSKRKRLNALGSAVDADNLCRFSKLIGDHWACVV